MKQLTQPGVIQTNASYEASEFLARTGLSRKAFNQARRNGLPVAVVGRRRFIFGGDWIVYLHQQRGTDGEEK